MDIKGLDKAKVLCVLYCAAKPMGMGVFAAARAPTVGIEHCEWLLKQYVYFDYLYERPMKIRLDSDELDLQLYNRDQGRLKGEHALCQAFGLSFHVEFTPRPTLSFEAMHKQMPFRQRYLTPNLSGDLFSLFSCAASTEINCELVNDLRVEYYCRRCETHFDTWRTEYEPIRKIECPYCYDLEERYDRTKMSVLR